MSSIAAVFAVFLLLPKLAWTAEPAVLFGLRHTPLGEATLSAGPGHLRVTSSEDGEYGGGEFGVSIELGEADSGLFGYLDCTSSFQNDGNYMMGHAYGRVNGQPDQFVCSLRANTLGWGGTYEIVADFRPLGATTLTYEVYHGTRRVASINGTTRPFTINTYSEFGPWANPFHRLPDGSPAAIIQLSAARSIRLPGTAEDDWIEGDRILIVPENATALVEFVSRLDVTAGGGEDEIVITQERLGMFQHGHRALGPAILEATNGVLTVARFGEGRPGDEIGVSVGLEDARRFALKLRPQVLTPNAGLMVSAVGSRPAQAGEYLGYAGLRQPGTTVQAFGGFPASPGGAFVSVYRHDRPVATVFATGPVARVDLPGNPQATGFDAAADCGTAPTWLAVRLDRLTACVLPDGSSLEGDQVRFRSAASMPLDRLSAVSLTASNLDAFTIVAESGPQTIDLVDYLADVTAPALLKRFSGTEPGEPSWVRSSTRAVGEGPPSVTITDRWLENDSVSATLGFQEDGLYWYARRHLPRELSSASGVRVAPEEVGLGRTYFSSAEFQWTDPDSGETVRVQGHCITKVGGFETIRVPAGSFSALRLETALIFGTDGRPELPGTWFGTNWLARGLGVVKFSERELIEGGAEGQRSGELSAYALGRWPAQRPVANVGANVVIQAEVALSRTATVEGWLKDRSDPVGPYGSDRLLLSNLSPADAGTYSLVLRLDPDWAVTHDVACLTVLPFSDTPPFWAASFGANWWLDAKAMTVDGQGNVYVASTFENVLTAGTNSVTTGGNQDIALVKFEPTGRVAWVRNAGGVRYDSVSDVATDGAGNVYLMGRISSPATFGSIQLAPTGHHSIFVTKLSPDGTFLWAVKTDVTDFQYGQRLVVESTGHQYLAGGFNRGVLSLGSISLTNNTSDYAHHLFLAKLDPNGQFLWARQVAADRSISPSALALDETGGLYVAGTCWGTVAFDDFTVDSGGPYQEAGFVAKSDLGGNFLWAQAAGQGAPSLALDSARRLVVLGQFTGTITLGDFSLSTPYVGFACRFLAGLGPDGAVLWARVPEQPPGYYNALLTVDASDNLYLAGSFYGEGTFGGTTFALANYGESTVVSKLRPTGEPLWHKHLGASTSDARNFPTALAPDRQGNVYLTGRFREQVICGETNLTSSMGDGAFVLQITGATPPSLTAQPQPQIVQLGEPVAFSVTATGTAPLRYEWRRNGAVIEGATGSSYVIAAAQAADAGIYSVTVRNAGGVMVSDGAPLEVLAPATNIVAFDVTACTLTEADTRVLWTVQRTGATSSVATVEVATTDGTATPGLDYWATAVRLRFEPGEIRKTVSVPIANDTEPEPPETVILRLGRPGSGTVVGLPDTATITIEDDDPTGMPYFTLQPAHRTVFAGRTAAFTAVARGAAPLAYQWRKNGVPIPDATNSSLILLDVQLTDAAAYSMVASNAVGEATSAEAGLTVIPLPDRSFVMFGLKHRPFPNTAVDLNGYILLTPSFVDGTDGGGGGGNTTGSPPQPPVTGDPGWGDVPFGVSVELGQADSGLFVHLDTGSAFQDNGHFTIGRAYGQLDGRPNQLLCSLGGQTTDIFSGYFAIYADFCPLGVSTLTYEVYEGGKLVGTVAGTSGAVSLYTYGEGSPMGNPFWLLADGSVAAIVQLSGSQQLGLPQPRGGDLLWVNGDRLVIRAENPVIVPDFVSRVEVSAGNGEDHIIINRERLGMFRRSHEMLGSGQFVATNGTLTIARLESEEIADGEMGASIALEDSRRFSLRLAPQALADPGAAFVASAVAGDPDGRREFLGMVGACNVGDAVQLFGSFSAFASSLHLSVYHHDQEVGAVPVLAPGVAVNVTGQPQILGFDAAAGSGPISPWLGVRLDRAASFALPDGSTVEGDQLRIRAVGAVSLDRLTSFSLTSSNLAAFTITSESGDPPRLNLAEFLPELTAATTLKRFAGWADGVSVEFLRTSVTTNLEGRPQAVLTDRWGTAQAASSAWSLQDSGLLFLGSTRGPLRLGGASGLRLLPAEVALGQTYLSAGRWQWQDTATGQDYPVEVSCVASVAGMDTFYSPTGAYPALRLETLTTFSGAAPPQAPSLCASTNWLVPGVGVVRFEESEVLTDGGAHSRSGVLTDFALVRSPPQRHDVNVGANVVLRLDWTASPSAYVARWLKNGQDFPGSLPDERQLRPVTAAEAGIYSVDIRLRNRGEAIALRAEVAQVRVLPFSDTPPFWATGFGANNALEVAGCAADAQGNVYVAGRFRNTLTFGGASLVSSNGSDDAFLLKLAPSGAFAWARQIGGQGTDSATGVGVDAAGNAYLVGTFSVAAQAGPIRLADGYASQGVFLARLDPHGNFLWATNLSGGSPIPNGIAVDAAGNSYVLGIFWGGVNCGEFSLSGAASSVTTFLTKLDAGGQFLWAKRIVGAAGSVYAGAVALDGLGGLYVTGSFDASAAFDAITLNAGRYRAGFLARTDAEGNFLWARVLGYDAGSVASDSAGNAYVTGDFIGTARFDHFFLSAGNAQECGAYLVKAAPSGAVLWAQDAEQPIGYGPLALTVDSQDNAHLAGAFYRERAYGGTIYQSGGYYGSTLLTKRAPDGQILGRKHLTGPANNGPVALTRDAAGRVYLAGHYRDAILFGATRLTASGTENGFVVQITGATAPTLTQQPQSSTVSEGEAVSFTGAATGTEPILYQWRKDGVDLPGATGPEFAIAHAQRHDIAIYTVTVKNAGGVLTSAGAVLQVLVPEAGTVAFGPADYAVQETNGVLVVAVRRTGNTAAAARVDVVTVEDTASVGQDYWGLAFSLFFAPGETSQTVSVPLLDDPVPEPDETLFLRLGNPGPGLVVGQPGTATIRILDNDPAGMPVIQLQPVSRLVAAGETVTFSVFAQGAPPLAYQWRKDNVNVLNATNRHYAIVNVQPADGGVYAVVVRNAVGEVASAGATLSVVTLPVILVQPQDQAVPYYEAATFSVVATSSFPTVAHVFTRSSTGPGDDWYNFPACRSGVLSVSYDFHATPDTLEILALEADQTWRRLGQVTTNGTGQLTVNYGVPGIGQLAIRVAPGAPDDGWSYRAEQASSPLTYRWRRNGYEIGAGGPTYTIDPVQFYQDGELYSVVVSDPGGSVVSQSARLTVVGPLLRIVPVPCPGNPAGQCVQLFWRAPDYHLEMIEDPEYDEWHDVPNARSGMIIEVHETQTFFRLARTQRPD